MAASVLAAAAALAACSRGRPAASPPSSTGTGSSSSATAAKRDPTSVPQATSTTSRPAPSTPALPPDPQPSAEQASGVFMDGWMAGDRARSSSVAAASAVSTLYATPYGGQPLNDRGCTDSFPPLICTWGPYAGGHGSIYQVQVSPDGSSWYVSSVQIES